MRHFAVAHIMHRQSGRGEAAAQVDALRLAPCGAVRQDDAGGCTGEPLSFAADAVYTLATNDFTASGS